MNEKKNRAVYSNGTAPRGCGRGEELVAYIYGETTPVEAKAFRQHLTGCAVCREELAAFGGVREAVGEWRAEVFGSIPSLDINESFAPTTDARTTPSRKRSAVAALREFFSLSPLWLQVGIAAAALVVCALAALTFARAEVRWDSNGLAFRTGAKERVVEKQIQVPVQSGYTREQVDAMVEQRVSSELADARAKWEAENKERVSFLEADLKQRRSASRGGTFAAKQNSRRPAPGGTDRDQLAGIDPFTPREERVPRLTDLLGEVNAPNK